MKTHSTQHSSRRQFLQFLAGSPLLGLAGAAGVALGARAVARANLPLAHLAYLDTGVEGDATLRANREGFAKFQIRPRRLVDSGFRRGTDIFKALALGAKAVCVGRPYIWGLAAYGQPGVERCLEILQAELEVTMRHMGTSSLASITSASVQRA